MTIAGTGLSIVSRSMWKNTSRFRHSGPKPEATMGPAGEPCV